MATHRINNRRAIEALIFARLFYAVNWYNFAAVFTLVARDMNQNVSGLGAVVGSFYLGIGLFQIPGGLLAAKIGPKRTAVFGTLFASSAVLLTSVTTDFVQLPVLRFLVGAGMAFVFAPGVILMARYFRERAEGFSVGIYNAAYYLGGALGIFAWTVLADLWGWRESMFVSGGVGIVSAVFMLWLVPPDSIREGFAVELHEIRKIIANRWLLLLGVGMFGVTGVSTLITAFMVYYLQGSLNASAVLAGSVGALTLMASLLASPMFGVIYDKTRNASGLILLCGLAGICGLEIASVPNILAAVFANLLVGFATAGALTIGFSAARELAHAVDETLAVSCINSTQLFAGFLFPPIFSATVLTLGYSAAWRLSGFYVLPFIAAVLLSGLKTFTRKPKWTKLASAKDF